MILFAEGFDPPKGEGRNIDTIIILQYSTERKVFLTVATCHSGFLYKKEHRCVHRHSGVPK